MLTEIGQLIIDERAGRLREQHLAAVPGRGDPRAQVDVVADVSLLGQVGRAGVKPHPYADRPRLERFLRRPNCTESLRCGRKRDEERIALRVHLDPAVAGKRLAQKAPMLGERMGVGLGAELVQ